MKYVYLGITAAILLLSGFTFFCFKMAELAKKEVTAKYKTVTTSEPKISTSDTSVSSDMRHYTDSIQANLNNMMEWDFKANMFKIEALTEHVRYNNTGKESHRRMANALYDSSDLYRKKHIELCERVVAASKN